MGMNLSKEEMRVLRQHVTELAGDATVDVWTYLRGVWGMKAEHYASVLSKHQQLPASFLVEQENKRHRIALENEAQAHDMDALRTRLENHQHHWWRLVLIPPGIE